MLTKDAASSSAAKLDALPFVIWGQERTEAALSLQKDLLAAYEQASRTWLARVQSEVALWSDLATKLAGTLTVSETLEVYAKCISQRMKMAIDDGRLLADEAQLFADEAQQFGQKIAKSLSNAACREYVGPIKSRKLNVTGPE